VIKGRKQGKVHNRRDKISLLSTTYMHRAYTWTRWYTNGVWCNTIHHAYILCSNARHTQGTVIADSLEM